MTFMFQVGTILKSLVKDCNPRLCQCVHAAAGREGQASLEYALMVPFLFLLIINAVNFGAFISAWLTVGNAARAAADYGILSSASVGSLTAATSAQIGTLVAHDTRVLPAPVTVG